MNYIDVTLKLIKSEEMREHLRTTDWAFAKRESYTAIVTNAPAPLEKKIPVLDLIAEQTKSNPEDENEFNSAKTAKQFLASFNREFSDNELKEINKVLQKTYDDYAEDNKWNPGKLINPPKLAPRFTKKTVIKGHAVRRAEERSLDPHEACVLYIEEVRLCFYQGKHTYLYMTTEGRSAAITVDVSNNTIDTLHTLWDWEKLPTDKKNKKGDKEHSERQRQKLQNIVVLIQQYIDGRRP
jgi:hypothetical protein